MASLLLALLTLTAGHSRFAAAAAPALPGWKTVKLNLSRGSRDGYLLVPSTYKSNQQSPLLVLLHGARKDARDAVASTLSAESIQLLSSQRCLVLLPESRGPTWDLIMNQQYGPDLLYLKNALAKTFKSYNINRSKVALAGFSDGATYALSLGTSGGPFTHVIAFSPGGYVPAATRASKAKVFISHGTKDTLFPIQYTSRPIVQQLKETLPQGTEIHYVEHQGAHEVPAAVSKQAMEWFLKGASVKGATYSQQG